VGSDGLNQFPGSLEIPIKKLLPPKGSHVRGQSDFVGVGDWNNYLSNRLKTPRTSNFFKRNLLGPRLHTQEEMG
jgi:hypothetical protein